MTFEVFTVIIMLVFWVLAPKPKTTHHHGVLAQIPPETLVFVHYF